MTPKQIIAILQSQIEAVEQENNKLRAALLQARASNECGSVPDIQWRKLLAITYCGFPALYCDDGELQDNRIHPFIDFKRDSVEEIWDAMCRRTTSALQLDCSTPTSGQPREVLIQRLEACQRILADERAAQPDGWKLVPIEPTEAMLVAMDDAFTWQRAEDGTTPAYYGPKEDRFADHKDAYRAMLAVAFKSGINPKS